MNRVIVRFSQREEYDIFEDAEAVMFMGTTDKGSYFHRFHPDKAATIRDRRKAFREACIQKIQRGDVPGEIELT